MSTAGSRWKYQPGYEGLPQLLEEMLEDSDISPDMCGRLMDMVYAGHPELVAAYGNNPHL